MPDYLNTNVGGTDAAGLYQSPQNVGNATVFKEPELTADKILMYAIQHGEEQRQKGQKSLKDMNDTLNKIKVEGYIQDQQELQKEADEVIKGATDFGVKYKRGYQDYNASDPNQSKDWAELQKKINNLEYNRQLSLDFQKNVAMINGKKSQLGKDVRGATAAEWDRVAKMPLSKRKEYYKEHGSFPDIDPQYNYADEALKTGKLIGADLSVIENNMGRVITNKNPEDSKIIEKRVDEVAHTLLGNESSTGRATNWAQQWLEDEINDHPELSPHQNYENALTKVRYSLRAALPIEYKSVLSPLTVAMAKAKATETTGGIGDPENVSNSAFTSREGDPLSFSIMTKTNGKWNPSETIRFTSQQTVDLKDKQGKPVQIDILSGTNPMVMSADAVGNHQLRKAQNPDLSDKQLNNAVVSYIVKDDKNRLWAQVSTTETENLNRAAEGEKPDMQKETRDYTYLVRLTRPMADKIKSRTGQDAYEMNKIKEDAWTPRSVTSKGEKTGTQKFTVNGKVYNIPDSQVAEFKKDMEIK